MAVMERERWTDKRLDEAFGRMDADIRELRLEMKRGFERVDKRFERVDDRFDALLSEMNTHFDSLHRTMIIGFASIVASVVGGVFAAFSLG